MSAYAPMSNPTPRSISSSRPKLREITLNDFSAIASFTEAYGFDPMRSRAAWEHLWVNNPAYISGGMRSPMGWILEADGRMVGHVANIPTLYRLGDRELVCASGRAWAMDEHFRGYAPLMLAKYLQQSGIDFAMTNSANQLSWRVHRELGASVVPGGEWDISRAWITRYSELLADVLVRKNFRVPRPILLPVAAALAAKDFRNRLQVGVRAGRHPNVTVGYAFDARFDEFWKQLYTRYPNKLLADRSRHTLQWHFHYAMAEGRVWIYSVVRGRQLVGYAVFVRDSYRIPGSTVSRVVLADFQSLEADEKIYFAILQRALQRCRQDGVALLVVNGFSASGINAGRLAPYHRKLEAPRFLYKAADAETSKLLAGPEAWCPSAYDADDTL